MKCVVPGANVKILARAVAALAKVGDELYVNPKEKSLSIRTVNMANSAYADFTFHEAYFSYYMYEDLEENEDALRCKISVRSAMMLFKAPHSMERHIETCHIILVPDATDVVFIFKYKSGITKRFLLPILDIDRLQANYDKSNMRNEVQTQSRVLSDAIQNFQQNVVEITMEVSPQRMLVRNFIDDVSGKPNTTRTQLALSVGEFERFSISSECTITFCLKELRAILFFAESTEIPIGIHFETAGKPVIFTLKGQSFEANIVLSTLDPESDAQTDTTLTSRMQKQPRSRAAKGKGKTTGSKGTRGRGRKNNGVNETTSRRIGERDSSFQERSAAEPLRDGTISESARNGRSLWKYSHPALTDNRSAEIDSNFSDTGERLSIGNLPGGRPSDRLASMDSGGRRPGNDQGGPSSCSLFSNDVVELPAPVDSDLEVPGKRQSTEKRKLVDSVFSTITRKRPDDEDEGTSKEELNETVPNSPPPLKKARMVFRRCFQRTFDAGMLPGYNVILADDSDEETDRS